MTEITQADRDAAAELLAQRGFTTEWVEQAFARHREEARNTRNAPADVVEAANNLTVKLTKWLIMNDTLPEDGSMVKVTDRFGTFCDDLLTEALASQPDLRELLKEARTGLSVLMDTSDDFTETGHMNLAQAANLIGRIDAALGESHDTNG